jgi:hypothetical protein
VICALVGMTLRLASLDDGRWISNPPPLKLRRRRHDVGRSGATSLHGVPFGHAAQRTPASSRVRSVRERQAAVLNDRLNTSRVVDVGKWVRRKDNKVRALPRERSHRRLTGFKNSARRERCAARSALHRRQPGTHETVPDSSCTLKPGKDPSVGEISADHDRHAMGVQSCRRGASA